MADKPTPVSKLQDFATIFAASLGLTLLFLFGVSAFVNSLIPLGRSDAHRGIEAATKPDTPAASPTAEAPAVPAAPVSTPAAPATPAAEPAASPTASAVPVASLLATANAGNGESVAKKCVACHTFDKGGKAKVGPNLYGIVGRPIAGAAGFAYSPPMQAYANENKSWTYDHLAAYLRKPGTVVPKTKMAFAGIGKDSDLADLMLYLRSLSDNPLPLPK